VKGELGVPFRPSLTVGERKGGVWKIVCSRHDDCWKGVKDLSDVLECSFIGEKDQEKVKNRM